MDPGGALPFLGPIFFRYHIFYFCSWVSLSRPLGLFFLNKSSQPYFNNNYPIQKFNKNNKNIHNGDCILAKKKNLPLKNQKNHVLLEKLKVNFCKGFVNICYYNYFFYSEFRSKLDPLSSFPLNGFSLDFPFVNKIFVMILLF